MFLNTYKRAQIMSYDTLNMVRHVVNAANYIQMIKFKTYTNNVLESIEEPVHECLKNIKFLQYIHLPFIWHMSRF